MSGAAGGRGLRLLARYGQRVATLFALGVAGLLVAIRYRFAAIPLGRNEGTYGYLGDQILRGAVPFSDFYEMKPVGLYYTYALVVGAFGETASGFHAALFMSNLATSVLVFAIGKRIYGSAPAIVAAVTFAFLTVHPPTMGLALDAEHLINLFVCLSLLLVMHGNARRSMSWFVLAGICAGWAALIKQTVGLQVVSIALFCAMDWNTHRDRALVLRRAGWLSAGALASLGAVFLYHVALGNLADALYWMVEYPSLQYGVSYPVSQGLRDFEKAIDAIVVPHVWIYLTALVGLIVCALQRSAVAIQARVLLCLLCVAAVLVVPGLRFYGHYWLYLAPPVSLAVGFVVARLSSGSLANGRLPWLGAIVTLAYWVAMPLSLLESPWKFFSRSPEEMSRLIYDNNPFPEIAKMCETIRARMRPGDGLVVFGSEPQAYLTLGLEAPSPHVFLAFLSHPHPRQANAIREFKASLTAARPRFAIFVRDGRSWTFREGDSQEIVNWSERYLARHYRPVLFADLSRFAETRWISWPQSASYQPLTPRSIILFERIEGDLAAPPG